MVLLDYLSPGLPQKYNLQNSQSHENAGTVLRMARVPVGLGTFQRAIPSVAPATQRERFGGDIAALATRVAQAPRPLVPRARTKCAVARIPARALAISRTVGHRAAGAAHGKSITRLPTARQTRAPRQVAAMGRDELRDVDRASGRRRQASREVAPDELAEVSPLRSVIPQEHPDDLVVKHITDASINKANAP